MTIETPTRFYYTPGVVFFYLAAGIAGLLCAANLSADTEAPPAGFMPGLAWVFFDDYRFERPRQSGIDPSIAQDTGANINDYAKVWMGWIEAPAAGEVIFTAEADDGLRVWIGGRPALDTGRRGMAQGSFRFERAGQRTPFGAEFFHCSRTAYARLFWQWNGRGREPVPPSAFSHTAIDALVCRAMLAGKIAREEVFRMEDKSSIYAPGSSKPPSEPLRLGQGPHLFIDDFLVAETHNIRRVVNRPLRDPSIPNPLITGKGDGCFQPYMTVLRDPQSGIFRIWYGHRVEDMNPGRSHIGYMESEDGIHWKRPARALKDPAPITFGASVIDDGPAFPDPARRFKYAWWHGGGLCVAASPDGLEWTPLAPGVVLPHNHDINSIAWDPLRKRYFATISVYETGPRWSGRRRVTMQSHSADLIHWSLPHYVLTPDDSIEDGQTQFYAMDGFIFRGDLLIGMVKVLHDDYKADDPPDPPDQHGIGYTQLAWSRDGEHWTRDREPFFERDPQKGRWDHAHAWIDEQVPVGDEIFLYYAGYARGHKVNRFEERQIGLVKMKLDRYVARQASEEPGTITTPLLILEGGELYLNVDSAAGQVRVAVLDEGGNAIEGFSAQDCRPISSDSLNAPALWQNPLSQIAGRPIRFRFVMRNASLFGFTICSPHRHREHRDGVEQNN